MKRLMEKEIRIRAVSCKAHFLSDHAICTPKNAVDLLSSELAEMANEKVMALFLNSKGKPICCQTVGVGSINQCFVSVQNIAKMALLVNACGVILLHNHPSNNCTPSSEDIRMTRRVKEALGLLEITLYDHIIVGPYNGFFSFKEKEVVFESSASAVCAAEA